MTKPSIKILALVLTVVALPTLAIAQTKYSPLVNIPGLTDAGGSSFSSYINFLYGLSISLAAMLAVVKIIIAGVKYMTTDVIPTKGDAKKDIQGALLGLLLIIGAVVILETINPQLIKGEPTKQFLPLPDKATVKEHPSVAAATGETTDQIADSLKTSAGNKCVNIQNQKSQSGTTIVYSADASSCPPEQVRTLLTAVQNSCRSKGGTTAVAKTGSKIIGCQIPIAGAAQAQTIAKNLTMTEKDGRVVSMDPKYKSIEGNETRVNFAALCDDRLAASTLTDDNARRNSDKACRNSTASDKNQMRSNCESAQGNYNYSTETEIASCKSPTKIVSGASFKNPDPKFPNADLTYDQMKSACGAGTLKKTGGIVNETFDLNGVNPKDYSCIFY